MKVGTEFTFRGEGEMWLFNPEALSFDRTEKGIAINEIRNRWKNLIMERAERMKKGDLSLKVSETKDVGAYTVGFKLYDESGTFHWYINIGLDNNCIETQTEPIDSEIYMRYPIFFEQIIFAAAADCGIVPDISALGGGGHISLDRATTFGNDVKHLMAFILHYHRDFKKWEEMDISEDPNINAPTLHELIERGLLDPNALKQIYLDVKSGKISDIEGLVAEFHSKIYVKKTLDPRIASANPRMAFTNAQRYQALALYDLTNREDSKRRLEMRRFDAQTSIYDFISDLEAIKSLVGESLQLSKNL